MVDKHREKLKKEKEEAALAALQQAVPHVGIGVCVLALEGTAWEAEAAVKLLQSFGVDKGPQLAAIQQVPLECKGRVIVLQGTQGVNWIIVMPDRFTTFLREIFLSV